MKKDYKLIKIGVYLIVALIFYFILAKYFSDPNTYRNIIEYLDEKKSVVMALAGSSAAASAAITLLPGDTGSSIAAALAGFSNKFLLVLVALYLEKYLLTIIGYVVCKIIVPIGCLFLIIYELFGKAFLKELGLKLGIFGLALLLMIPSGVWVSKKVEEVYSASINETLDLATDSAKEISDGDDVEEITDNDQLNNENDKDDKRGITDVLIGIYNSLQEVVANLKKSAAAAVGNVADYVGNIPERITNILNRFMEALAVLIITSCVIPLLVVFLFAYLIKLLFGLDLHIDENISKFDKTLVDLWKKGLDKD